MNEPAARRRISSGHVLLMKWGYPAGVVVLLLTAFVVIGAGGASAGSVEYLAAIALMILVGALMYAQYVKGLVESVYDCGDHLDVRSGGERIAIRFSDMKDVCYEEQQPYRVTLLLNQSCALGSAISFLPRVPIIRLIPSAPVVADLVRDLGERVRQTHPKDHSV